MNQRIVVLLGRPVLHAYEGNDVVFESNCVTGDRDHPTDVGRFRIFRKHRKSTSRKYMVPMDHAMLFTRDGKAILKSHLVGPISYLKWMGPDAFGSRGCVRLAGEDATALFDWAPMGTPVEVRNA